MHGIAWMSRPSTTHPVKILALSLVVTVAVFVAAEVAVRLAGIEPQDWPASDLSSYLPWIEVDPLLGPLPNPGWSGLWFGTFETEIDEHGFRRTAIAPPPSPECLVAFLGDSCTFGWDVDTAETFVSQLASIERAAGDEQFEFVNAAYPGHSASIGVYMLRERVLPLHPDVVVLGYSANNAFRFSLMRDADRFHFFGLRKLLLRSRLFHIVAAKLVDRMSAEKADPRNRNAVTAVPLREVRRVASVDDFEEAMRTMVADTRAAGAKPMFLVFPRASEVSTQFSHEDVALVARMRRGRDDYEERMRNIGLLEASCLDHLAFEDPMQVLVDRAADWEPVYPPNPVTRGLLKDGARAYVAGELDEAATTFKKTVALAPRSPLAHYDLGVSLLGAGQTEAGLAQLDQANHLACNVFLQYQVVTWEIAADLDVPVVDLALYFQSHAGEKLFIDPAHPNAAGHRIIAEAMWAALHDGTIPGAGSLIGQVPN